MDRKQFKRPLAANQLIQFKLAEQMADINLGLQAVLRATRLKEGIQSTCLEVRHGSDFSGMETKAVDKGDHYVLNGAKNWITSSPIEST